MPFPIGPAIAGGSAIIASLLNRGGGQSDEAIAGQLALSKMLMDMLQREQNVALPYQQKLLDQLRVRTQRQFPVRRPGDQPIFNPFGKQQPYQIGGQQGNLPLGPYLRRLVSAPLPEGVPPWVKMGGDRPIIGKPAPGT